MNGFSRLCLCFIAIGACSGPAGAAALQPGTAQWVGDPVFLVRQAAMQDGVVARGPRGGVAAGRVGAARPPVARSSRVRPGVRPRPPAMRPRPPVVVAPRPGVWVRPSAYWWHPGMAVMAGAAIGFVSATAAAAWAGSPPAPGNCWYYTDPSRRQGFWDVCP